jgi:hypothetical protein
MNVSSGVVGVGLGEAIGIASPVRDLLDQARLRAAVFVRVDLRTCMVCADLQALDRVGERIHVVRVAAELERDERGNRSAVLGPEVADRLARNLDRQRLFEQLIHPRTGSDDDDLGVEVIGVDAGLVADIEVAGKSLERLVCADDPGFRL